MLKMLMLYVKSPLLQAVPEHFFDDVPPPKFMLGARVSWRPLPNQDCGVVTGIEYAPATHLNSWGWRYTVWLDARSPSARWIASDLAWEDDLILLQSDSHKESGEGDQP